jgi:hypothetical protein
MDIVPSEYRRGIEVSLGECRPPAAPTVLHEGNFESERLEDFHRGNANVRFMVPDKCVVPKNDLAAVLL